MKNSLFALVFLTFPVGVYATQLVSILPETCPWTHNSLMAIKMMGYDIRYGEPKENLMTGPALCVRNHIYWRVQGLANINVDLVTFNEVKCASSLAYSSVKEFWDGVKYQSYTEDLGGENQSQESKIRNVNKIFKGVNLNCREVSVRSKYVGGTDAYLDELLEIPIGRKKGISKDAPPVSTRKPMPIDSQGGWEPIID